MKQLKGTSLSSGESEQMKCIVFSVTECMTKIHEENVVQKQNLGWQ